MLSCEGFVGLQQKLALELLGYDNTPVDVASVVSNHLLEAEKELLYDSFLLVESDPLYCSPNGVYTPPKDVLNVISTPAKGMAVWFPPQETVVPETGNNVDTEKSLLIEDDNSGVSVGYWAVPSSTGL